MILPNLHRIAKVTLAFVLAFILFIRLFIVDVSALSVAPVVGEALVEVFSGLLVGSGMYTAEEVSDMSWADAESAIDSGISSGFINPLEVIGDVTIDGVTKKMNFLKWLAIVSKTDTSVVTSDTFGTITDTSLRMTLHNYVPVTIGNWFDTSVDKDDVIDTPSTDMNGYGAMVEYYSYQNEPSMVFKMYSDYGIYSINDNGSFWISSQMNDGNVGTREYWYNGNLSNSQTYTGSYGNTGWFAKFYGDWRTLDGTAAETDDTYSDVVGEDYDGNLITYEDIKSGAIPLDDTTLDYLDYDKFTDDAVVDLLQQILAEFEQVPVVEEEKDNTIAEDFSQELDGSVSLELEDINALTLPTGIATVFPFCLPFDFAYGLELLAAKPVPPKFEIPFEIPSFGLYPGTKNVITLDMAQYSKYFEVGRWVQIVIFSIGLCFISFKVVKGVH